MEKVTEIRSGADVAPVVLVHGLGGTPSGWSALEQVLSARGTVVKAIGYSALGTSVERLADRLVSEVDRTLAETGADKVHLVGHSLGGLIIAQALASDRLRGRVGTVVTIGTPFGGSPWASVLPLCRIVRELRAGSPLLRRLRSAGLATDPRWVAFAAASDRVVPGRRAVPRFRQVRCETVAGVGHRGMRRSPAVISRIAEILPAAT
jgi:triacylglycerol lipase